MQTYIDYPEYRTLISKELTPEHFDNKQFKEIIIQFFNNNIDNMDTFIDNIEANDIKQLLMKLVVKEKEDISSSALKGCIMKLKEKYRFREKKVIYHKLQEDNLSLKDINSLLLDFHKLNKDYRKEGSFDG